MKRSDLTGSVVSGLSLSVMESQPEGDITYNIEISNEGFALLSKETEVSIYLSQNVNLSAGSYKELLSTLKLQAETVNVTVRLPSVVEFSFTETGISTEVFPAGIITVFSKITSSGLSCQFYSQSL